jgi:hypothetical protein
MIYYFLYELLYFHFKDKDWYLVKALNVFQYVTFRTAYATITALLISLFFGGKLIDALRQWNVGQQIREEGPQAHQTKRGTPTMGGVLIVGSVLISTLLWARLSSVFVWTAMGAYVAVRIDRIRRRLLKDCEAAQSWFDRATEVVGAVAGGSDGLGGVVSLDKILGRQRLLLEFQHSVHQSDRETLRTEFHWTVLVPRVDCSRAARIVERSEFD